MSQSSISITSTFERRYGRTSTGCYLVIVDLTTGEAV
jgi:hypothetical protein